MCCSGIVSARGRTFREGWWIIRRTETSRLAESHLLHSMSSLGFDQKLHGDPWTIPDQLRFACTNVRIWT